ncbi:MAG: SDR family oxidoreductase [Planctomycetota bacterium]|nr:SDR family oxidoreductase [Planctomycetota bacterium]
MTQTHEPTIQQLFDLTGRVALITGGTGHLGTAFSKALAEAGATVVISSREVARAKEAAAALPTPKKQKHLAVTLDQMDSKSLDKGFTDAVAAGGKVDILVNNGLEALGKDLTNCTFEEFARHQVNNAGYFILARHVRNHIVERKGSGSVIMIGSMYGQVGSYPDAYEGVSVASPVAYHALKGGTIHMTRHLACYWAKDNVRVNCLSPGPFPPERINKEMVARLSHKNPMKRMGKPEELKGAIVYLASDASSFVTGQNMTVDGGWTAW